MIDACRWISASWRLFRRLQCHEFGCLRCYVMFACSGVFRLMWLSIVHHMDPPRSYCKARDGVCSWLAVVVWFTAYFLLMDYTLSLCQTRISLLYLVIRYGWGAICYLLHSDGLVWCFWYSFWSHDQSAFSDSDCTLVSSMLYYYALVILSNYPDLSTRCDLQ